MGRTSNPAGGGVGAENRLDFPEEMTKAAGRNDGETDAIRSKKHMTYFSLYQKKRRKRLMWKTCDFNGKNLPGFPL